MSEFRPSTTQEELTQVRRNYNERRDAKVTPILNGDDPQDKFIDTVAQQEQFEAGQNEYRSMTVGDILGGHDKEEALLNRLGINEQVAAEEKELVKEGNEIATKELGSTGLSAVKRLAVYDQAARNGWDQNKLDSVLYEAEQKASNDR